MSSYHTMYGRLKRRYSSYMGSQPGNAKYLKRGRVRAAAPRYRRSIKYRGNLSAGNALAHVGATRGAWRGENFLPLVFSSKFVYTDTFPVTQAAPGFVDYVYRGNSCYDPYVGAGGASQPLGFAYLCANGYAYQNYKVLSSKIEVTVTNLDDAEPIMVAVIPSLASTSLAAAYCEGHIAQPYARSVVCTNNGGPRTVTNYMTTKKIFDLKDCDDVSLGAAYNADPARVWCWHISIWPNPTQNIAANCQIALKITYFTDLYNLSPLVYT